MSIIKKYAIVVLLSIFALQAAIGQCSTSDYIKYIAESGGELEEYLQANTKVSKQAWDVLYEAGEASANLSLEKLKNVADNIGEIEDFKGGYQAWKLANGGRVFKEVTKDIAKQELPTDFVNALKKMDFTEDKILESFAKYHNDNDFRFFNEVGGLMKKYPQLNKTDVNLLWGYTTNIFYKNLNLWLREATNVSKTKSIKELLNSTLSKMDNFRQPIIYRGIGRSGDVSKYLNEYIPGTKHTWSAFTSCGSSHKASFIDKADVIFEIRHLDAKDISDFADGIKFRDYPRSELLIKSGSEFKVKSNHKIDVSTGKPIIELIQIK